MHIGTLTHPGPDQEAQRTEQHTKSYDLHQKVSSVRQLLVFVPILRARELREAIARSSVTTDTRYSVSPGLHHSVALQLHAQCQSEKHRSIDPLWVSLFDL